MEKGEEENGGENNPNNKNGDGDNLDSGGNGSDETGVDPAEHTGENGTAVVSNGKTDDNQNKKDTSQESQEQSDNIPAPDAAEHDPVPPEVPVKTDTSKSNQEPSPGSSSNELMQRLQVTEHDNGASQSEGDEGPEEAAVTQLLATLYYTTSPEEVPKQSDEAQDVTDLSDKTAENTDASDFEVLTDDEFSSDEEAKTEIQVTDHDNGASQRKEGEQVCDADANTSYTEEVSQAIQPDSSGGPGTTPDMPEETSRTKSSENESTNQPTKDSPEVKKSKAETQAATDSPIITSEETGNTNASRSESTGSSSGTGTTPVMPEENRSPTLPTTHSPGEALEANEEVKKSKAETQAATDSPIITSEETGNTNASRSESTGSSSVNEPMKKSKATEHDNGASQGGKGGEGGGEFQIAVDTTSGKTGVSLKIIKPKNPGDGRAPPPENKQSGSENLQSESGSSHSGHAGGKGAEETEAQKRDANGRSEEEMKTGSGANKDDKEGQPKKKKAKGEGGTTHAVKTKQRVIKERRVSISLCTSAYSFNVEGLVSYLNRLMKKHPELIKEVKVHELPYNDLDNYRFDDKDPVDVMILCHSINNRGFSITDVMDALYDEYLPYCARVVGKEKMGVIVHDFDDMRETVQSSRMSSFKYKQPKAFETTSLQITCGHIEKEEQVLKQMLHADREKIVEFLEYASKYPEEMQKEECKWSLKRFFSDFKMPSFGFGSSGKVNEGQIEESAARRNMCSELEQKNHGTAVDPRPESTVGGDSKPDPPRGTSPVTQQSPGAVHATAASGIQHAQGAMDLPSQQNMTQNSEKDFTSALQSSSRTPRRISVSVCSSAYQNNVKGLLSWFANFQAEYPHLIADVRFQSLPYNEIDSFKFPPNDPVDVMVLCHSVDNRGISITNIANALYEKYLKYCNKLIGKKRLAVIVHDLADCKPATVEDRMESFRRMQPLTFELVDTVIICGSLEDSYKLGIREDDLTRLICFLELAGFVLKENFKQSMFGKRF